MAKLEKLVDDLSTLTVLEAAELSKLLEEKWGVSAAAPVAVAAAPAGGAAAPAEAAEEQTEFTVVLTAGGDKKINVIKEVRARPSGPRPEGSQGPRRRRSAEREGKRLQAGSRRDQEEARRSRRFRPDQVASGFPRLLEKASLFRNRRAGSNPGPFRLLLSSCGGAAVPDPRPVRARHGLRDHGVAGRRRLA